MQKIRVAIIGQGRSGRDIHGAHLINDDRYEIVATVDPMEDRRDRSAEEYGCDVYPDHTALLSRKDIDLVVNASPSKFHAPYTLEFLEAGFNVLCEKPFASKAADADAMIAAAEKSGKVLAVFQQSRYAPYFQQVRKVIESGVLGELVQVNISFSGFSRRYDWQTLTDEMGGNLLNTGPHPMDQALQIFGTDVMPEVFCIERQTISYGTADDHTLVILKGEGRPIVQVEISSCAKYPRPTYVVYGTRGGLEGHMKHIEWSYFDPGTAPKHELQRSPICKADGTPAYCSDPIEWTTETWDVPPADSDLFSSISGSFYTMLHKTLTEGAPLEITPQQVRQQIAVIEECHRQNPQIWQKA